MCCDSWGGKESDTTERLIWSEEGKISISLFTYELILFVFFVFIFVSVFCGPETKDQDMGNPRVPN